MKSFGEYILSYDNDDTTCYFGNLVIKVKINGVAYNIHKEYAPKVSGLFLSYFNTCDKLGDNKDLKYVNEYTKEKPEEYVLRLCLKRMYDGVLSYYPTEFSFKYHIERYLIYNWLMVDDHKKLEATSIKNIIKKDISKEIAGNEFVKRKFDVSRVSILSPGYKDGFIVTCNGINIKNSDKKKMYNHIEKMRKNVEEVLDYIDFDRIEYDNKRYGLYSKIILLICSPEVFIKTLNIYTDLKEFAGFIRDCLNYATCTYPDYKSTVDFDEIAFKKSIYIDLFLRKNKDYKVYKELLYDIV